MWGKELPKKSQKGEAEHQKVDLTDFISKAENNFILEIKFLKNALSIQV